MRLNCSAGLFVTGAWLAVGGSAVGFIGIATMGSSSASAYSSGPNGFSVLVTLLAAGAAMAGWILISIAICRALAKIDALAIPSPHPQAAQWQGQQVQAQGYYPPQPQAPSGL